MTDPRYKLPKEKRKFDGKAFTYYIIGNKAATDGDAARLRGRGNLVRVVPWHRKFAVYYRKAQLKKTLYGHQAGYTIYLVDGTYVRNHHTLDFTHGGHDKVFDFIPKGEVWIDNSLPACERVFLVLHEVFEARLMRKGVSYPKAHRQANKLEIQWRQAKC